MRIKNENTTWKDAVLQLRQLAEANNVSQQQLAERAEMSKVNVSRIFALKYPPTIKTLAALSESIGYKINFVKNENE